MENKIENKNKILESIKNYGKTSNPHVFAESGVDYLMLSEFIEGDNEIKQEWDKVQKAITMQLQMEAKQETLKFLKEGVSSTEVFYAANGSVISKKVKQAKVPSLPMDVLKQINFDSVLKSTPIINVKFIQD